MDSYFFPSGVRIDFERIVDAALTEDEFPRTYVDSVTGILIEIASSEMLARWKAEVGVTDRYVLIKRYPDEERDQEALAFIELILRDLDEVYALQAHQSFEKGGWRALEHFLEHGTEGWIDGWDHFVGDAAGEYVHEWLMESLDVPITVKFEGCGNCTMCELFGRGEGSSSEAIKGVIDALATENVMRRVQEQLELRAKGKRGLL